MCHEPLTGDSGAASGPGCIDAAVGALSGVVMDQSSHRSHQQCRDSCTCIRGRAERLVYALDLVSPPCLLGTCQPWARVSHCESLQIAMGSPGVIRVRCLSAVLKGRLPCIVWKRRFA